MDSLTQIVLGAAVGEVVLGKKVGNKAMLWGALAGTIPDLDVYQSLFFDSLRANELHRGFSHSILFSLIFAPILAWFVTKKEKWTLASLVTVILAYPFITIPNITVRLSIALVLAILLFFIFRNTYDVHTATRRDWTKLMFWSLITHPLLDCHTTWGTQLLWPLPHKLAWNNIFVVDPLYTIPFLVFVVLAMFYHRQSRKRQILNWTGIALSCFYMLWTLGVKWHVHSVFTQNLKNQNIEYTRITTVPTPFNSILWLGTAETDSAYEVGLYSLLDSDKNIAFDRIIHSHFLIDSLQNEDVIKRLRFLSKDWYVVHQDSAGLSYFDARFGPMYQPGEKPSFVFGYNLIRDKEELKALQQDRPTGKMSTALSELYKRMWGK